MGARGQDEIVVSFLSELLSVIPTKNVNESHEAPIFCVIFL